MRDFEDYLGGVDGVLISRRELSLTVNPSMVPIITKEVIRKCKLKSKLVLTASEMLGSMRTNPTPTRAEVSDVANAVIDGTDAVKFKADFFRKDCPSCTFDCF